MINKQQKETKKEVCFICNNDLVTGYEKWSWLCIQCNLKLDQELMKRSVIPY